MNSVFRNIFLFVLIHTLTITGYSQTQPLFNKLGQEQGLSNSRVTSIVKEDKGFVWIATKNGLNRYDGKEIKVYNKQNSSISANDISDLLLDQKGRLWISTLGGGLNLYDSKNDNFLAYKSSLTDTRTIASNQVNTITEDSQGNLWLGTESGICKFNEKENNFTRYIPQISGIGPNHNAVNSIYEDEQGYLWVGTFGSGLLRFDIKKEEFKYISPGDGYFTAYIYDISKLSAGKILVGTGGGGLLMLDTKTLKFSDFFKDYLKQSRSVNIVRSIMTDRDGSIWVGTDGNGLLKIEKPNSLGPTIDNYRYNSQLKSSLSGNAIYEIMEDAQANIWIGTAWNGINILSEKSDSQFLYSDIKGQNPYPVLSLYKDENLLFMGLDGNGLTVYNYTDASTQYFNKNDDYINGNYIQYITKGTNNRYWLGSFANGLTDFNLKTTDFTQYKHIPGDASSLSYNDVRYVIPEDNGDLWVATWGGGLNYFNAKEHAFLSFRESEAHSTSLSSDNVIAMQKDADKLWLATFGGGLELFNTRSQKFTHHRYEDTNTNSISSNNLFSLLKDSRGNLWIGTSGEGINRLHIATNQIERFTDEKNIRYATITAIIEDDSGRIWFSTKQGIFNYDYNADKFTSFPHLAGEFHINAALKDEKGWLYFGGINGVLRFNPEEVKPHQAQPAVKLTNFKLFNKELPIDKNAILPQSIGFTKEITLAYDDDVITFEFAALQFPFSNDCEYAIKMENFDENWRNIGSDRTATFTNLSPGDYTFKVKSREAGSDWGRDYASVDVLILKPFWLEWWAFVIYAILIILLFYLFQKYIVAWEQMKANLRLEKLTHEKDTELYSLKQQFFTNISHEIRTPITLILSAINRLSEKNTSDKKREAAFVMVRKHGNHLLNLVNELLDIKNLENKIKLQVSEGDFVNFCEEIFLSFGDSAGKKEIEFKFKAESEQINIWFDKNQMEKVLYNLLSNAFKFTPKGGRIKVEVNDVDEYVELKVVDSGIGIAKKQLNRIFERFYQSKSATKINEAGFGLGLSISKEIVNLHHGDITASSERNTGSVFIVRLPKDKEVFKSEEIQSLSPLKNEFSTLSTMNNIDEDESNYHKILQGHTILIAEDNGDIRSYLVDILGSYCNVIEAVNGEEAFKLTVDEQPDLVLSDIMMPVLDGIRFTSQLKTDMRTSHIPVILLTARATFSNKIEGFDTGADDYITKPFHEKLLLSRIINLIENRRHLREKFGAEAFLNTEDRTLNKTNQKFLKKLVETIQDNIDSENLNAEFLSKELGMSHSVIYKKIKSLTGMTFVEFVRDYKLQIAKNLISEQGFSVAEASYKVGYADRKYFSRLFKQKFGENPSYFSLKK